MTHDMAVGFKVGFFWYQIGSGDFLHCFFSTVAVNLENDNCNFFYKVNGKVVKKSRLNDVIVDGQEEYDVSIPRQRDVMAILNEDMVALRKLCEEYQREMPTQIKLIYDVAANSLNADYSYDIIYSNDKDKMAEDVLEEWYESEKSKEE